jgi:hypothetical protein
MYLIQIFNQIHQISLIYFLFIFWDEGNIYIYMIYFLLTYMSSLFIIYIYMSSFLSTYMSSLFIKSKKKSNFLLTNLTRVSIML